MSKPITNRLLLVLRIIFFSTCVYVHIRLFTIHQQTNSLHIHFMFMTTWGMISSLLAFGALLLLQLGIISEKYKKIVHFLFQLGFVHEFCVFLMFMSLAVGYVFLFEPPTINFSSWFLVFATHILVPSYFFIDKLMNDIEVVWKNTFIAIACLGISNALLNIFFVKYLGVVIYPYLTWDNYFSLYYNICTFIHGNLSAWFVAWFSKVRKIPNKNENSIIKKSN